MLLLTTTYILAKKYNPHTKRKENTSIRKFPKLPPLIQELINKNTIMSNIRDNLIPSMVTSNRKHFTNILPTADKYYTPQVPEVNIPPHEG